MGRACSTNEKERERERERRTAYRILVGKPKGRIPLGRPRHRWVNSIKMDLREIGGAGIP
jgi:hypothetical protein